MEINGGVERRRCWRLEEKLRIVAGAEQPGVLFAAVARRHEVSRGLLWTWRRQVRSGALAPKPMPAFLPVRVVADAGPASPWSPPSSGPDERCAALAETGRIEITLPDGTRIRMGADVGLTALRRVMTAVRR